MRWLWSVIGAAIGVVATWRALPWLSVEGPVRSAAPRGGDAERGAHLARTVLGCPACHGDDLGGGAIGGGWWYGTVAAPDLTPRGACCAGWDREAWASVLRSGRGRDGRLLRWMPSWRWAALSDDDLADVLAWLERLPPAASPPAASRPGPGAWVDLLTGPGDPGSCPPDGCPGRAPDAPYGAYLGALAGCADCHGPALGGRLVGHLAGGPVPPRPGWTGAEFARAIITDGGDGVAHAEIPTADFTRLDLTEIDAIWQWARAAR